MNSYLCESCQKEARIICYCSKVLFCEECIGKHLLLAADNSHKPVVLNEEYSKIIEISIKRLRESEAEILNNAERAQNIKLVMANRLKLEVDRLDEFYHHFERDQNLCLQELKLRKNNE